MSTPNSIKRKWWDPKIVFPNFLSILRLLLLPLGIYYVSEDQVIHSIVVFGVIALTDALDGLLARHWNCTTKLGKILDHLVDKIIFLVVTYVLVLWRDFPLWAFLFLLLREIGTLAFGGLLVLKGVKVEPNIIGRVAGFFLAFVLLIYFLRVPYRPYFLWISLLLLLEASLNYFRIYVGKFICASQSKGAVKLHSSTGKGQNENSNL